ncbi:MAG: succinate dehydrogenase cytochrome b subunit [Clostridia bacterium]|nr:succinate dehydrogenase cytochrome b subunit [Clostridia bacterium]MBR3940408.1 succinate dehydrogenase cytochrome b subunit [Bacteroidales bacterium]
MNLPKIASISKKIVVACVGLFLLLFLLVHLGINLCLLRPDDGAWFIAASNFMGTNYIVKVFEVVLFAVLFIHIILTIALQIQNWKARPVRYSQPSRSKTSAGSKTMIWTGGLVLCFLVLHFANFYFVKLGWVEGKYMIKTEELFSTELQNEYMAATQGKLSEEETAEFQTKMEKINAVAVKAEAEGLSSSDMKWILNLSAEDVEPLEGIVEGVEPDFYHMSYELFQNKAYSIIYIILFIALAIHLVHAMQSAFQTLGLNHNKYNKFIEGFSWIYAIVIAVGFAIIPIYIMFFV